LIFLGRIEVERDGGTVINATGLFRLSLSPSLSLSFSLSFPHSLSLSLLLSLSLTLSLSLFFFSLRFVNTKAEELYFNEI
jgi:hypothetical protein